jgi:hypothetical protein
MSQCRGLSAKLCRVAYILRRPEAGADDPGRAAVGDISDNGTSDTDDSARIDRMLRSHQRHDPTRR